MVDLADESLFRPYKVKYINADLHQMKDEV